MKRGFTLVEIMVVISIVIILVSFTLPNILRSRVITYECLAIANLQILNRACQSYHIDQGTYPTSLLDLSTASPPYIDGALGSARKQSYEFIYALVNPDHFTVNANSLHITLLKGRYFYLDESGIIRFNRNQQAGPNDEVIE